MDMGQFADLKIETTDAVSDPAFSFVLPTADVLRARRLSTPRDVV